MYQTHPHSRGEALDDSGCSQGRLKAHTRSAVDSGEAVTAFQNPRLIASRSGRPISLHGPLSMIRRSEKGADDVCSRSFGEHLGMGWASIRAEFALP